MTTQTPLKKRPLDLLLVVVFSGFALSSFLFDAVAALELGGPLGEGPIVYGEMADPLVLANPHWLQVASGVSAFVFGPFYLVLVYALAKDETWIDKPALVYVGAMLYSMVLYYSVELFGALPPTNYAVFLGATLPYIVMPALLGWRVWRRVPVSAP